LGRAARWQFDKALTSGTVFSQGRERSKTTIIRAIHGIRVLQRALATRARDRGGPPDLEDFWLLNIEEVSAYMADPLVHVGMLAERRRLKELLAGLEPPFIVNGEQPPIDTWRPRSAHGSAVSSGTVLAGIGGCPGVATGRARIVLDPGDPRGLGAGDVLVAPITDPAWTPLFLSAEAVVVDVGAAMSHAVIVSRELGIPCVVSVTGATTSIPDGAEIEVDGTAGTVRVL
jgi:pyruvate,water dikinase